MAPFQGLYLRDVKGEALTTYYAERAQRRALQLHRFISELMTTLPTPRSPPPELIVAASSDWSRLSSQLYGLPTARLSKTSRQLLAAAEYPERLFHRFDPLLFRAKQQGYSAPGELREFLDLMLGQCWGQLAASYLGLASGVGWADALIGAYLLMAALHQRQRDALAARLVAWATLMACGAQESGKLSDYRSPRSYAELNRYLALWARLTLRAGELIERELAQGELGRFGRALAVRPLTRRSLASRLTEVDASFSAWLAADTAA